MKGKTMTNRFNKAVLIIVAITLFGADVYAGGIITGEVQAKRKKYQKDVVVYLKGVKGKFKAPKQNAIVDQKNLVFIPHVQPVLAGTTVEFKNSDNVNHNVFSPAICKKFNLGTFNPGMHRTVTFDEPCVVDLLCNVHSEMLAYIVVLDNPYFAKTDKNGKFKIENVPAGTYEITAWSEKLKPSGKTTVTVTDGKTASVDIKLKR
jgi:plastocyanin